MTYDEFIRYNELGLTEKLKRSYLKLDNIPIDHVERYLRYKKLQKLKKNVHKM